MLNVSIIILNCLLVPRLLTLNPTPSPRALRWSSLQVGASDEHRVTLTNLTHAASGIYTCEAMSDGPAFFSSARSTRLAVLGECWRLILGASLLLFLFSYR